MHTPPEYVFFPFIILRGVMECVRIKKEAREPSTCFNAKIQELGLTEKDHPLDSIKIAQVLHNDITVEHWDFKSNHISGILYKGE
jgi:hypothetical protein